MKSRFNGRAVICLILMAVSATAVLIAWKWPMQTALFPVVIGIMIFLLAIPTLILLLTGKEEAAGQAQAVDREITSDYDEATTRRRTLIAFGWVIGFFLLIFTVGFSGAVLLFVLAYTRFQGGEKWWISLVMALLSWLFIWALFVRTLHIPFQEGLVQKGLRLLGII